MVYTPSSSFAPLVRPLVNQRSVQAADTVSAAAAGTAETAFPSSVCQFAPGGLRVGESYVLRASGLFTTSAVTAPTQTPRVRLGGVALIETGALSLLLGATNALWNAQITFSVRQGGIEAEGVLRFVSGTNAPLTVLAGPPAGTPAVVDLTVAQQLRMTTQYSAATAGNSVTLRQCTLQRMEAA